MAELDEFLGDEPEEDAPALVAETPAPETPETPAEPEAPAEPVETPKEPEDVTGLKSALQAERAKRNDYKGERDRLAGELAAMKAQIEAIQKTPPAPATPPAPREPASIPNPVEDPNGYHAYIQKDIFNRSLNMSEAMLRQQVGNDADVDAKVAKFRTLADANPSLRAELQASPHPYRFVYDHAAKVMAMEEIGDPAAYRSKLEAEIREKLMAEMAGTTPQTAARVQLPQSLGNARSTSNRNMPAISVPESLDDILAVPRK